MASRKRTATERKLDLHMVAMGMALGWRDAEITRAVNAERTRRFEENQAELLRKQGLTDPEIERKTANRAAEVRFISRQQVIYDKTDAETLLIELTQRHAREEIGRQLMRLDEIWREAMTAWRESKQDAREITVRQAQKALKHGGSVQKVPVETKTIKTAPRAGDPRLLKIALDALQERTDLLRLRERELTDKVAEHPQFDANEPTTLEDATQYLEATAGSRFARHGRLRLVEPKNRHKR